MIDEQTYLRFCDEALVGMRDMVLELGDDLANTRPDLPGANTPYAILTHCLAVVARWASTVNLGEIVPRDRDAEFVAIGPVAALAADTDRTRVALRDWVARSHPRSAPANPTPGRQDWYATTQGGVLFHVYEELAQHRGHLELTRDVLLAAQSHPES
ncbi:hypothetical protein GCM10009867_33850 [Pedococcus aerophilus]|uniref:DUF664 domain-containing protein n=1 Tax=Pedococcus aerophilus TaxID=436356 RepID=A0ABP6HAI9_9MICO